MSYRILGKARQKLVRLTLHAEERAETRRISSSEILEVLKLNQINVPGKGQTRKIYGTVRNRRLVVYVEEKLHEIVVTTVAAPDEG